MLSLLVITMISISINYDCYENFNDLNRGDYLFKSYLLPNYFYSKAIVLTLNWISIFLCLTFLLLVGILSMV